MKALLYQSPRKVDIREVPAPEIGEGEALLSVEACGLCGTDLAKIYHGALKAPVPLGHEVAGTIVQVGKGVRKFKAGDRVVVAHHVPCFRCHYCTRGSQTMCREFKRTNLDPGGFAELTRVSARHLQYTTVPIPSDMDYATASQVEPLACCLRNVRRLGLSDDDTAVVVGLGSIGLMLGQALRHAGAHVIGLDVDASRLELGRKLGLKAYDPKKDDVESVILAQTAGRGADAAVLTAASSETAAAGIRMLRDGGTLNIFAGINDGAFVPFDFNALYHREISILSSYSAAPEDLQEAMRLISQKIVRVDAWTANTFPLERFNEAARRMRGREILKAIILPQRAVS